MKNIAKKGIVLVIFLGKVLLLRHEALASASCVITVKNTFNPYNDKVLPRGLLCSNA